MEINRIIDHTLLKPEASEEQIEKLLKEAIEYNFFSVCVNPTWVKKCSEMLKDTGVKVCTVIGFPLGANTLETKVFETKNALDNGADEIDMVINVIWKVILENCLLTKDEIKKACQLADKAGADFVKTSTGFSTSGADAEDVKLMKESVSDRVKVKASGGIRDYKKAMEMVNNGADRLGVSAGLAIYKESKSL